MLTSIQYILDESGSMYNRIQDVISGFNKYIADLREEDNTILFSFTKFNTGPAMIYNNLPIMAVPELGRHNYKPSGGTALYDAIGTTVQGVSNSSGLNKIDRYLVTILTDGMENSSKEWTRDSIYNLIKEKEATGRWSFSYTGADQNAWEHSSKIGIPIGNTMSYNSADTQVMYGNVSDSTKKYLHSNETSVRSLFEN